MLTMLSTDSCTSMVMLGKLYSTIRMDVMSLHISCSADETRVVLSVSGRRLVCEQKGTVETLACCRDTVMTSHPLSQWDKVYTFMHLNGHVISRGPLSCLIEIEYLDIQTMSQPKYSVKWVRLMHLTPYSIKSTIRQWSKQTLCSSPALHSCYMLR